MKKIKTLRELQLVSIYVYKKLLTFCKENDLKLYLLGGTLIGAVREQRFIKWDDDIDVCMSRKDYEKMLYISKGKISSDCSIIDPETNALFKGYISLAVYDKSRSVSKQYREVEESKIGVSIFVYDGVPKNIFCRNLYFAYMFLLRAKHALCRANFEYVNSNLAKNIGPFLSLLYNKHEVYKYKSQILKLQKRYKYDTSELVAPNTDTRAWLEVFPKIEFEKNAAIMFEEIPSNTFSYYKEHLAKYYGDYMIPPPNDEREPKHSFEAWVDNGFVFNEEIEI